MVIDRPRHLTWLRMPASQAGHIRSNRIGAINIKQEMLGECYV